MRIILKQYAELRSLLHLHDGHFRDTNKYYQQDTNIAAKNVMCRIKVRFLRKFKVLQSCLPSPILLLLLIGYILLAALSGCFGELKGTVTPFFKQLGYAEDICSFFHQVMN